MGAHELTACAGLAVALCERHGWHGQWADVGQGLYYLRPPARTEVTLAQVVQLAVAALEETPADEMGAELVRRLRALHSVDASRDNAEATPRTGAGVAVVSGRT